MREDLRPNLYGGFVVVLEYSGESQRGRRRQREQVRRREEGQEQRAGVGSTASGHTVPQGP